MKVIPNILKKNTFITKANKILPAIVKCRMGYLYITNEYLKSFYFKYIYQVAI